VSFRTGEFPDRWWLGRKRRSHHHKTKLCESPSQYEACGTSPLHRGAAHYQWKCNDYNKIHVFVKMEQYIDGFQ